MAGILIIRDKRQTHMEGRWPYENGDRIGLLSQAKECLGLL